MKYKKISIIIPVYNEERFIKKIISKVVKANTLNIKKEIIIINDGSIDKTKTNLDIICQKNKNIIVINKKINEGKGSALKIGFLKSTGDIVLIQDSDLEYDPVDYPLLLKPFIENGADVVFGSRFISSQPRRVLFFWHYLANICLTILSNLFTNLNLTDMETGYKVFKGDIIQKITSTLQSKRFGFEPEITAKIARIKGIKIYEVGISYFGRTYSEGKKIGWIDGINAIGQIMKFNIFAKNKMNEELLEPFARLFRFKKSLDYISKSIPITVVDLGCGPEIRFYKFLIKNSVIINKYIGVDPLIDNSVISKYKGNNKVVLIKNPLTKSIPLDSNSVDLVVGFAFLEHVDNPEKILKDSYRLLKINSTAIYTTPTIPAKKVLEFLAYKLNLISKREIREHKNYFSKQSLIELLKSFKKNIIITHKYFEFGLNNLLFFKKIK